MKIHRLVTALAAGALVAVIALSGADTADSAKGAAAKPSASRVVFFASDGMRTDLMKRNAAEGAMPTYKALMEQAVRGDNGLQQGFPPNTGVGWYTLATGAWPSEHGSTNNTFFRAGDAWNNRTSFSGSGVLQADTGGRRRARRQEGCADRLDRRHSGCHHGSDGRLHELLLDARRARDGERRRAGRGGLVRHLVPARDLRHLQGPPRFR